MRFLHVAIASTLAAAALVAPAASQAGPLPAARPGCVNTLYVVEFTGSIRTVNTVTNLPFGKRIKIGKTPGSMVIDARGTTAWVTNNGGGISVIDLETRTVTQTIDDSAVPTNIAMSPDGSTIYVANARPGGLTVIDTATNEATTTPLAIGGAYGVAVSADGQTVYVSAFSSSDTYVYALDAATLTPIAQIQTGSKNKGLALSPDGSQLWVSGNSVDQVHVIQTSDNTLLTSIDVGNKPERITFAPDGQTAWVTNIGSANISVIDVDSLLVEDIVPAGPLPFDVAFTPDGTTAYVSNSIGGTKSKSPMGTVTVIDVATGGITKTIKSFWMPDNLMVCNPSLI